jgi:multiple antibiotic resistance protein
VALLSFLFLSAVFVIGPFILLFFGVSINFIRISGGLLLAITSWQMITAKSTTSEEDREHILKHVRDVIFYPLTFPITVGAGSIAISIAIASDYMSVHHSVFSMSMSCLGGIAGIGGDMILVAVCYRFADAIFGKLGYIGTVVITRLSAFILVAIGLQVAWAGLSGILTEMLKAILLK